MKRLISLLAVCLLASTATAAKPRKAAQPKIEQGPKPKTQLQLALEKMVKDSKK